jgi:LmbE family N-acetylglucosaminyl deacetylase
VIDLTLPDKPLTVLAVGAHPDDVEIACGGTLLELCARREVTAHVLLLTGSQERRTEAQVAVDLFLEEAVAATLHTHTYPDGRLPNHWDEVKSVLEDLATTVQPDLVLAPRKEDAHQDHRLLGTLVPTVWRNALVLHYEIPKWDGDMLPVTHYVPVPHETAHRKVELLDKAYQSQLDRDWWDEETFMSILRLRGMESRNRYAEGFVTSKVQVGL